MFVSRISFISNVFDPDIGWHLRFGKEFFESGFNKFDTHTFTYYGKLWVNHEWGGDILFWWLYRNFGYMSIVLVTSCVVWLAFILSLKIFERKLSITSLTTIFLILFSVRHILVGRLAMFSALFFILLWWTLERIPRRKYYYLWPFLFWIWSVIHGSWILGFITVLIYIGGNIIQTFLQKIKYNIFSGITWEIGTILKASLSLLLSMILILLNPYNFEIYKEVLSYFTNSYYKQVITEWISIFTYPIYPMTFLLSGVSFALFILALRHKKISAPQVFLYAAFLIAGLKYKRHMLYFALISAPLISACFQKAIFEIKSNIKIEKLLSSLQFKITLPIFAGTTIFLLFINFIFKVNWSDDLWSDRRLLASYPMPINATGFLKARLKDEQTKIFNKFVWGGYLNWHIPQALVYLDGRGTATWRYDNNQTLLEHYHDLLEKKDGLKEIEALGVEYIVQENATLPSKISIADRFFLGEEKIVELKKINEDKPQIYLDLAKSAKWKIVFEDQISKIWKKN